MVDEWDSDDAEELYELTKDANIADIRELVEVKHAGRLPENSWAFSMDQLWDYCLNSCDVLTYEYLKSVGLTWEKAKKAKLESSWGEVFDSLIDECIVPNVDKGADQVKEFLLAILSDGYKFVGSSVLNGFDELYALFADDVEALAALDKAKVPLCPEPYDPGTYGRANYIEFWSNLMDAGHDQAVSFLIRRGYHLPDELEGDSRIEKFQSIEVDEDRRLKDLSELIRSASSSMTLQQLKAAKAISNTLGLRDGSSLVDDSGIAVITQGVVSLEEGTFSHNNDVKAILLPASLKKIAEGALVDLPHLIAVGTYQTTPADAQFEENVFWAGSVEQIYDWPWALDGIDEYHFGSSLKDVAISEAQGGWNAKKRPVVTVEPGGDFSSKDGILYDMGGKRLVYCPNENKFMPSSSTFVIPDGVDELYDYALAATPFSEVIIPASVRKLGCGAFKQMPLQSMTLPGTIKETADPDDEYSGYNSGLFAGCEGLAEVTIEEGFRNIAAGMFYGCTNLLECKLPSSLKSIGFDAFNGCRNLELVLPDGCTDIHPKAFGSGILSAVRTVKLSEKVSDSVFAGVCANANGALIMQRNGNGGYQRLIYLPDDNDEAEARSVLEALWETWEKGVSAGLKAQDEFFANGRLKRFYTKIRIAICRLAAPEALSSDAKSMYEDYLSKNISKAKSELDSYEGAPFLKLLGLIDGYDAVEPSVSGTGVSESTGWHLVYYEQTISDEHERLDEMGMDAQSFEDAVRDAIWSLPATASVEGTSYNNRNSHIESLKVGDPVVLASDWCSEYEEPLSIEVFDSRGRTLGLLGYCEGVDSGVLGLLLPYITASVKSVTPVSARHGNAKNSLLEIKLEIEDGLCDDATEKATPEVLLQLEALLDLEDSELVLLSKGNLKATDLKGVIDTSDAISELPAPAVHQDEDTPQFSFAETDMSEGEPDYLDADGNFIGESLLWLLAEDFVFFNDFDFSWDGEKHVVTGAQVNSPKKDDIPLFVGNLSENATAMVMLMRYLENDKQLQVDRDSIHSALYEAIREGDLTATTLVNLVACDRAWRLMVPSAVKELENNHIIPYISDPAPGQIFTVSVDDRLARGIPNFYLMVTRLFWDMRKYRGCEDPFRIRFITSRVLDYNPTLEFFEGSVDGAEMQPFTYTDVTEEPKVKLDLMDLLNSLAGDEDEEEDQSSKDAKAFDFGHGRAEAEDAIFTVGIPDGYKCVYKFESAMGEKPFALLPEDMPDNPETAQGRAVFQYVPMPVEQDDDTIQSQESFYTPDLVAAIRRLMSSQDELHLNLLKSQVVQGINCPCLVSLEQMSIFGAVYNLKIQVLQYDAFDYLRIDAAGMSLERSEALFDLCCQLAQTVQIKEPKECELLRSARSLLTKKVSAKRFEETFEKLSAPLMQSKQLEVNTAHSNFCALNDMYNTRQEVFSQAGALQLWTEENSWYMQLCYDAYKAQEKLGAPYADLVKMHEYLDEFSQHFHVNVGHRGDEWDVKAKSAGVIHVPDEIVALEKKWKKEKPAESAEEKARREAAEKAEAERKAREEAERIAAEKAEAERKAAEEAKRDNALKKLLEELNYINTALKNPQKGTPQDDVVNEARINLALFNKEAQLKQPEHSSELKSAKEAYEKLKIPVHEAVTDLSRLREELAGAGIFSFGKKNDLKSKIAQKEAELAKLNNDANTSSEKAELDRVQAIVDEEQKAIDAQNDLKRSELASVIKGAEQEAANERERLKKRKPSLLREIERVDPENIVVKKERLLEKIGNLQVGDKIKLGSYYYDKRGSKKEPLTWRVLDRHDSSVLLITDKVIDGAVYHRKKVQITWEACDLRKRLNSDFINTAFSDVERSIIAATTLENKGGVAIRDDSDHRQTLSGPSTTDLVFCLSFDELYKYFTTNGSRMTGATAYAASKEIHCDDNVYTASTKGQGARWMLRSLSSGDFPMCAVDWRNGEALSNGSVNETYVGLRPALWISLE